MGSLPSLKVLIAIIKFSKSWSKSLNRARYFSVTVLRKVATWLAYNAVPAGLLNYWAGQSLVRLATVSSTKVCLEYISFRVSMIPSVEFILSPPYNNKSFLYLFN